MRTALSLTEKDIGNDFKVWSKFVDNVPYLQLVITTLPFGVTWHDSISGSWIFSNSSQIAYVNLYLLVNFLLYWIERFNLNHVLVNQ
jgi:hypothetical protein